MNGTTDVNRERFAAAGTDAGVSPQGFRPAPHTLYPISTEEVRRSPAVVLERVTLSGQTLLIHPVGPQGCDFGGPDDTVAVLLPYKEYRDLLRLRDSVLALARVHAGPR